VVPLEATLDERKIFVTGELAFVKALVNGISLGHIRYGIDTFIVEYLLFSQQNIIHVIVF